MPLMICPKCKKFHYVPGACPAPKLERVAKPPSKAEPDDTSRPVIRSSAKPRNADRHKPGYQAQKQREYRARKNKAKRNG